MVRNLAAFNGVVILMLVPYAYFLKMPLAEIIPLVPTAVLASIGRRRNRDDALAGLSGGWDAFRSNSLRRRLGFGEGSCIRSSQDRLKRHRIVSNE